MVKGDQLSDGRKMPIGDLRNSQLEKLPTPRVIVGWDGDWLEATPCCLAFWEKLSLEPYARPKHVSYVALIPGAKNTRFQASRFFRELSAFYGVSGRIHRMDRIIRYSIYLT
jgi:hypothetical protein